MVLYLHRLTGTEDSWNRKDPHLPRVITFFKTHFLQNSPLKYLITLLGEIQAILSCVGSHGRVNSLIEDAAHTSGCHVNYHFRDFWVEVPGYIYTALDR